MTEKENISEIDKKEKKILSIEEAREVENFYHYKFQKYTDKLYRYKENGFDKLIYKGKDILEGLEVEWVESLQFNEKNELVCVFRTDKGKGVWYNGEVLGGKWKSTGVLQFNKKNKLAFKFETEEGEGVWYNNRILGKKWKKVNSLQFDVKGRLVLEFETEKGEGVYYGTKILGEWKQVWNLQFDKKGKLAFTFITGEGDGVWYGEEIYKKGVRIWNIVFDTLNTLVFTVRTEKGCGVSYDGIEYGGEWERVSIYESCIIYKTKEGREKKLSYEEYRKIKKKT